LQGVSDVVIVELVEHLLATPLGPDETSFAEHPELMRKMSLLYMGDLQELADRTDRKRTTASGEISHGHDHHQHDNAGPNATRALTLALVLKGGFLVFEAAAGIITASLALLSGVAHMVGPAIPTE
jgi:hypothetical protein